MYYTAGLKFGQETQDHMTKVSINHYIGDYSISIY